jgi:hypothetical protein
MKFYRNVVKNLVRSFRNDKINRSLSDLSTEVDWIPAFAPRGLRWNDKEKNKTSSLRGVLMSEAKGRRGNLRKVKSNVILNEVLQERSEESCWKFQK